MRFEQPLGIIQPVDADRQLLAVQAAPQPRHIRMHHRLGGLLGEFLRVDADRKHRSARAAVARGDHAILSGETEIRPDIGQEIFAIVFGLESDQIVSQHRLDQFAMMRDAADDGARGPRRVQEKTDRLGDAEIAQFRAQRQEVIILNPERGVRLLKSQQRARHEGVHFAIAEIIFLRGADQVGAGMQRRPQRRIGETFVISAVMRGRQIQHGQRTRAQCFNFGERFLLRAVADAAAGTYPNRAGFLHHRQQRGRQSPCHGFVGFAPRYTI